MGLLASKIKTNVKAIQKIRKKGSVADTLPVSTGFRILDAYLASRFKKVDEETKEVLEEGYFGGLGMGKLTLFVGASGSGKTTAAIQVAYNMVKDLNGDVVIFDYEKASNNLPERVQTICGIDEDQFEETFSVVSNEGMDVTTLQDFIVDIAKMKRELKTEDMVDWYDDHLNPIKIYPPTVLIVDSIARIRTDSDEDDSNNMTGAATAKKNSEMLAVLNKYAIDYNITMIAINHITTKVITNKYAKHDPVLSGLSAEENLPGGIKWAYDSSYALRFYSGGAAMTTDKDFKVAGREVEVRVLKTRSSFNDPKLKLGFALTAKVGFLPVLCDITSLHRLDLVEGSGVKGFYTKPCPDFKWTKAEFIRSYYGDPEYKEACHDMIETMFLDIATKNNDTNLVIAKSKGGRAASIVEADDDEI